MVSESLEDVCPGDTVVERFWSLGSMQSRRVQVERVTKAQVVTEGGYRWRKSNGDPIPRPTGWSGPRLLPPTEHNLSSAKRSEDYEACRRASSTIRDALRKHDLSLRTEQLSEMRLFLEAVAKTLLGEE